jgi:iron complex transport system ATP-binding protein
MSLLTAQQLAAHHAGRAVLQGLDLSLEAGELLMVIGPNGAGKSTLLKVLTGEHVRSAGTVTVFGRDLAHWPRDQLACRLAVLPQQGSLNFDFSVRELVELGRLPHAGTDGFRNRLAVDEALHLANLTHLADRSYLRLSGGERQRAHFARCLCQLLGSGPEPSIMLLDEPTSALDLSQQQRLLDVLKRRARQGHAALLVMHELNLAIRYANRLLMLKDGQLWASGIPTEILDHASLETLYGAQLWLDDSKLDGRPLISVRPAEA